MNIMATIGTMVMSINSVYNGKKIADMTPQEKCDLIENMAHKGTKCIIEGFNDKQGKVVVIEELVKEEKLSQNAKLVSERFSEDVNVSEFKSHQDEIMKLLLQGTLNIPEGYIFKDENGNVINASKIVLEKKKPKYPTKFTECCEILYPNDNFQVVSQPQKGHKGDLLFKFQKLLICRDAYWKIAGDWKPDWAMYSGPKHCIIYSDNEIKWQGKHFVTEAKVLAFPTEEMRDTFYENFKDLIEECKELL